MDTYDDSSYCQDLGGSKYSMKKHTCPECGHESKWCEACKAHHPATTEYFSRNHSRPDGLHPTCKVAVQHQAMMRDERREHKAQVKAFNASHDLDRYGRPVRYVKGTEGMRGPSKPKPDRTLIATVPTVRKKV